jgi:hypothetical protein
MKIFKLVFIKAYHGTQILLEVIKNNGYGVVDIGFAFKYFDTNYTHVSIGSNGYVCLGNNSKCGVTKPSPHDSTSPPTPYLYQFKIHFNLKTDYDNNLFFESCQLTLNKSENMFNHTKRNCISNFKLSNKEEEVHLILFKSDV